MFSARPLQEKEIESLQEFSSKKGNEYPIQLWDVGYWARLQKKELFGYRIFLYSSFFYKLFFKFYLFGILATMKLHGLNTFH